MNRLAWLIVGLVAGVLAAMLVGGVGLIGDIVVGAFVGGWFFSKLSVGPPFSGLLGTIVTAFVGAVMLLFLLHLIFRASRGP